MSEAEIGTLLAAMRADGMSAFWIALVEDQGPRGCAIGRHLWDTMPARYRG